jgi:pimeloyl-ACP methyl ester carboxylesterase
MHDDPVQNGAQPSTASEELLLPDTPAGRQLSTYVHTLNSGNREAMRRFIAEQFAAPLLAASPVAEHLRWSLTVQRITGGLRPLHLVDSTAREIAILARVRASTAVFPAGALFRVTVQVTPEPPHRVTACVTEPEPLTPAHMIDIGGRRLALKDSGSGTPVVVFDTGMGSGSEVWEVVIPAIAHDTRVISYDRAGIGSSDPAPTPRTCLDMATDLHAVLRAAGVPGPYVLVGHSMAGLTLRLFAQQHPREVAGMVLVDCSHPDLFRRQLAVLPPAVADEAEALAQWRRFLSVQVLDPATYPEPLDWPATEAQVCACSSLGDLPLAVVSAADYNFPPGLPADYVERASSALRELQAELASLSSQSLHMLADQSGHFVQRDQPEVVVTAIRHVMEAVRRGVSQRDHIPT